MTPASALEILELQADSVADQVLVAAVRWQRAGLDLHAREAEWYRSTKDEALPTATATGTAMLYQEFQMAKAVYEGSLGALALATRRYMQSKEID